MNLEKKIQLLNTAYLAVIEMSKLKNKTVEEVFIIDSSQKIFNLLDDLLGVYSKIVKDTTSGVFKELAQTQEEYTPKQIIRTVVENNTISDNLVDAIVGVGGAIMAHQHMDAVLQNDLEHKQINEFNHMMSNMDF